MKYGFTVPNNFGVDDPADVAEISAGLATFAAEHGLRR